MRHRKTAQGGSQAFSPKKGDGHRIESARTEGRGPVKGGRNMGGRGLMGERVRTTPGAAGR